MLPDVDREALLVAMAKFDQNLRGSAESSNWETNRAQKWTVNHDGRRYPPKKIISLTTHAPVGTFNGGSGRNRYQ